MEKRKMKKKKRVRKKEKKERRMENGVHIFLNTRRRSKVYWNFSRSYCDLFIGDSLIPLIFSGHLYPTYVCMMAEIIRFHPQI
jgi:hypothetical protein